MTSPLSSVAAAALRVPMARRSPSGPITAPVPGLVRKSGCDRVLLVTLCRDKIQAADTQVKTITEQLERETPGEDGSD